MELQKFLALMKALEFDKILYFFDVEANNGNLLVQEIRCPNWIVISEIAIQTGYDYSSKDVNGTTLYYITFF